MIKKHKITAIASILILMAVIIGIYFAVSKKMSASNPGNISVTQMASESGQVEIKNETIEQPAQEESQQAQEVIDEKIEAPIVDKKTEPAKTPEKTTANKTDDPSIESSPSGGAGKIVDKLVSWGFQKSSGRKIDTIIVHSSYNSLGGDLYDADKIIGIYKQYGVAAHYLILRSGTTYRLVEDKNIAWHAGVSKMPDGRTNVNDFSIGIEMINTMDRKYTADQYDALNSLIATLKGKYGIKYILGHEDIAPGRKTDPWGIDWKKVDR